jgi:hypothetical protein
MEFAKKWRGSRPAGRARSLAGEAEDRVSIVGALEELTDVPREEEQGGAVVEVVGQQGAPRPDPVHVLAAVLREGGQPAQTAALRVRHHRCRLLVVTPSLAPGPGQRVTV